MKKIIAALVFTIGLILCGCGDSADAKSAEMQNGSSAIPSEGAVSGVSAEGGEGGTNVSEPDSNNTVIKVTQGGPYGEISISLPDGWSYEACPVDSDDLMYGKYGIRFYPEGVTEGYIALTYYDWFGVCGTGLKEEEVTIAGNTAHMGTYDNHDYWDFVTFRGDYEGVVVANTHRVEEWWSDYGDQALDILDTLGFDPDVKEGGAYVYSEESWIDEVELHFSLKNVSPTGATLVFDQHDAKAPKGQLIYGDDFVIEVLKDGKWEKAPIPLEGNYGFNAIAYMIIPEDRTEQEISWKWLYGELAPGEYRIGKGISDHVEPGDNNNYMIYAHFILSESSKGFELSVVPAENEKAVKIMDNKEIQDGGDDYALYYCGLDEVNITVNGRTMPLYDALTNGKITLNEIIAKANTDVKNGMVEECFFRDGGSQIYQYEDYAIIKYHTADGINRDMYIVAGDIDVYEAYKTFKTVISG